MILSVFEGEHSVEVMRTGLIGGESISGTVILIV